MRLEFIKMNGAANDFVMIDGINQRVSLSDGRVRLACDRRRGVGADGLIVLRTTSDTGCDFHMEYYNSDGFPAEMCGNGSRCAARFGAGLGLGSPEGDAVEVRFSTDSGPIDAIVQGDRVRAGLMAAREMRREIPVRVAQDVKIVHFMVVGTRHAVIFVDEARDISGDEIKYLGRIVRNDPEFAPAGANVNFASIGESGAVHLRTYEKGVEAETYACGTGSVAAAVLLAHDGRLESPVNVLQHSGDELTISFRLAPDGATDVTLEGPVATNFAGTLEL